MTWHQQRRGQRRNHLQQQCPQRITSIRLTCKSRPPSWSVRTSQHSRNQHWRLDQIHVADRRRLECYPRGVFGAGLAQQRQAHHGCRLDGRGRYDRDAHLDSQRRCGRLDFQPQPQCDASGKIVWSATLNLSGRRGELALCVTHRKKDDAFADDFIEFSDSWSRASCGGLGVRAGGDRCRG